MFRYILPIILVGGKSFRMGLSKFSVYFKFYSFLDYSLFLLFDIGFLFIFLGGVCFGYFYIPDMGVGPVSSFYSFFFEKHFKFFFHYLFISVDMLFLSKNLIYFLMFNSYRCFSYYFNFSYLPFLFCVSNSLICFFLICKYKKISVYFFLKSVFSRPFITLFIYKDKFLNINTFFDLFLRK